MLKLKSSSAGASIKIQGSEKRPAVCNVQIKNPQGLFTNKKSCTGSS
jgi:hypothetical protein